MLPHEQILQAADRPYLLFCHVRKLVVIQLGALHFANTHDHGTEWVKWGGIVVSIATVVVGVATGG